jgi:hypothetical protein
MPCRVRRCAACAACRSSHQAGSGALGVWLQTRASQNDP